MKKVNYFSRLIAGALTLSAISTSCFSQWSNQVSGFSTPGYGIFSMSVVDANTIWGSVFDSARFITAQENGYFARYKNLFTRTTNAGATWIPGRINVSNPDSLIIDFVDAINKDTAWVTMLDTVAYGGSIYKTTNGGASWVLQNNAALPMFAAPWGYPDYVHFFNDSVGVCIGDSNGTGLNNTQPGYWEIYTTTNGGALWTRVGGDSIPANSVNEYAIDNSFAAYGNSVWFGTSYGNIYRSTNSGAGWSYAPSNLPFMYVQTLAMDSMTGLASDGLNLVTTANGGGTWNSSASYDTTYISWMCYVPESKGNSYFTTSYGYPGFSGTSESTDGGNTWAVIDTLQHGAVAFFNASSGWSGGFDSSMTRDGMFSWGGTTGIAMLTLPGSRTLVYPNPMTDKAIIQVQDGGLVLNNASLLITNELGSVVYSQVRINGNQLEIQKGSLAQGIYFYRLTTENAVIGAGKIIIQ